MGALAAHFKGRGMAYEIWNEQNLQREWEGAPLSASDYVRLLSGAYQAVKAADPSAIVVSGAPTPTGINDGSWAIDDRSTCSRCTTRDSRTTAMPSARTPAAMPTRRTRSGPGATLIPAVGTTTTRAFSSATPWKTITASWPPMAMAASASGPQSLAGRRSTAWASGPAPATSSPRTSTEQQQADYLVRAYQWSRSWGHAGVMFLWNLNFWPTTGPENEMAKYGIVRGDWSPRPAYTALKNMPK